MQSLRHTLLENTSNADIDLKCIKSNAKRIKAGLLEGNVTENDIIRTLNNIIDISDSIEEYLGNIKNSLGEQGRNALV